MRSVQGTSCSRSLCDVLQSTDTLCPLSACTPAHCAPLNAEQDNRAVWYAENSPRHCGRLVRLPWTVQDTSNCGARVLTCRAVTVLGPRSVSVLPLPRVP
jgi:hypothetical protein